MTRGEMDKILLFLLKNMRNLDLKERAAIDMALAEFVEKLQPIYEAHNKEQIAIVKIKSLREVKDD